MPASFKSSKLFSFDLFNNLHTKYSKSDFQVYQASSGKFMCRNKLYGRTLTMAGFQKALNIFLHDGVRLRTDALPPLIRRLEELLNTLSNLESIRLYTTSLLLLYEGDNTIR